MVKLEDRLRDMAHKVRKANKHLIGTAERKDRYSGVKAILREILAGKFSKLMKVIKPQIQDTLQMLSKINSQK